MKRKKMNLHSLKWLLICILLFSCNKFDNLKSPIDGFKAIINYDIFNTFLSFRFIDAETGNLIGGGNDDQKVTVTFSGASAEAVIDQLGNHEESFKSVYGLMSLALNPNDKWVSSPDNVASIHIEANCDNYKTSDLDIRIDTTGKYEYLVMMEKTSVETTGVKKYVFHLKLNNKGELIEKFNFTSTANEVTLAIPEGTQFAKANGEIDTSSTVTVSLTIYNTISNAPIPYSLLQNIIDDKGTIRKMALDLYSVIDISIKNSASEFLTNPLNHPLTVRHKIKNSAYQPEKKQIIAPGDKVNTYTYHSSMNGWQPNGEFLLQTDPQSNYIISEIDTFCLHASGMHIGLCELSGNIKYNLTGDFPTFPVPASLYFYRRFDARYISNQMINIPENGFQNRVTFLSPENTPVQVNIWNYSNTNPFTITPAIFYFDQGCGTFEPVETNLTSTSVPVTGIVKLNFVSSFPENEFEVYADIYKKSDNNHLWRSVYKIGNNQQEFEINTNLPANNEVYLKLTSVRSDNIFESAPVAIDFNTSSATNQLWQFNLTPLYTYSTFNFHFDRAADLPIKAYPIRIDFTNPTTKKVEATTTINVDPGQDDYAVKMFLPNNINYKVNIKRVDNSPDFMAFPYEFRTNNTLEPEYSYTTELSAVVHQNVRITLKVVCAQSEIIPTLHGYYRTEWEDSWHETDMVNGVLAIECEMNAAYIIGMIINGKMEVVHYQIKETDLNLEFKLTDEQCAVMGW
jgi:hypothetical protein